MIEFDAENPTEQDLRQIDIHELLPQQEPFVMIGTLTHFDRTLTVTETEVNANNIFVDNGHFTASGLMENAFSWDLLEPFATLRYWNYLK